MNAAASRNFRHLHYFWAVAKDGNLTRTAARLRVSQSALSAQIRPLESSWRRLQRAVDASTSSAWASLVEAHDDAELTLGERVRVRRADTGLA